MNIDKTNINQTIDRAINEKIAPIVELEKLRRMEYLTVEETAKLFFLEKNTLNTQRSRGIGPPYVKIGSRILYPVEGVREYMRNHLVKTTSGL